MNNEPDTESVFANKAFSIPHNQKILEQKQRLSRPAPRSVLCRSNDNSISEPYKEGRLLIGSIGWAGVGFHGAKGFSRDELRCWDVSIDRGPSKKGFISNVDRFLLREA